MTVDLDLYDALLDRDVRWYSDNRVVLGKSD